MYLFNFQFRIDGLGKVHSDELILDKYDYNTDIAIKIRQHDYYPFELGKSIPIDVHIKGGPINELTLMVSSNYHQTPHGKLMSLLSLKVSLLSIFFIPNVYYIAVK